MVLKNKIKPYCGIHKWSCICYLTDGKHDIHIQIVYFKRYFYYLICRITSIVKRIISWLKIRL